MSNDKGTVIAFTLHYTTFQILHSFIFDLVYIYKDLFLLHCYVLFDFNKPSYV